MKNGPNASITMDPGFNFACDYLVIAAPGASTGEGFSEIRCREREIRERIASFIESPFYLVSLK